MTSIKRHVAGGRAGGGETGPNRRKHRFASVAIASLLAEAMIFSSVTASSASAATLHANGLPSAGSERVPGTVLVVGIRHLAQPL